MTASCDTNIYQWPCNIGQAGTGVNVIIDAQFQWVPKAVKLKMFV